MRLPEIREPFLFHTNRLFVLDGEYLEEVSKTKTNCWKVVLLESLIETDSSAEVRYLPYRFLSNTMYGYGG